MYTQLPAAEVQYIDIDSHMKSRDAGKKVSVVGRQSGNVYEQKQLNMDRNVSIYQVTSFHHRLQRKSLPKRFRIMLLSCHTQNTLFSQSDL